MKTDNIKLSPTEKYRLRKEAVRLRKKGKTNEYISKDLGLYHTHISTIWQKVQKGGADAIKPKIMGRRHGDVRSLSSTQENLIKSILLMSEPFKLGLQDKLWTRNAIRQVIKKKCRLDIPLRTLSDYCKRWGLVPQKPIKRVSDEVSKRYGRWLSQSYCEIVKRAKKENFEIYWVDSCQVYIEEGLDQGESKSRTYMISAISNEGQIRFMLYSTKMTFSKFKDFVARLISDAGRTVFLIMYNKEVYQTKSVHSWLNGVCKNPNASKKVEIEWLEDCYLSLS